MIILLLLSFIVGWVIGVLRTLTYIDAGASKYYRKIERDEDIQ